MIRFTRFAPGDLELIAMQDMQVAERPEGLPGLGDLLAQHLSFSGWAGTECIICSGIEPLHHQRAYVWAYVSKYARPHMLELTRFARKIFDDYPAKRLEATVLPEFRAAHRWMAMLGFEYEATLEAYDQLSRELVMYKRIRR